MTSIDKTAQLLMDNRQDLHFDNEYKIFAIKRFQLKLVKSFPMPLCVSTTDTLCHWNIVRFYRTELCKQGTSDNATTESDYIVFILQRNGSISTTSRHGNHHTFTRRIAKWQRRSPWPDDPKRWVHVPPMTANCKQRPFSLFQITDILQIPVHCRLETLMNVISK